MDRVRTSIVWVIVLATAGLCAAATTPAPSKPTPSKATPSKPRKADRPAGTEMLRDADKRVLRVDPKPPATREIRTTYYRIHTDLEPELAGELARRMDGMYELYARRLSGFGPADRIKGVPR